MVFTGTRHFRINERINHWIWRKENFKDVAVDDFVELFISPGNADSLGRLVILSLISMNLTQ